MKKIKPESSQEPLSIVLTDHQIKGYIEWLKTGPAYYYVIETVVKNNQTVTINIPYVSLDSGKKLRAFKIDDL
jgi:hypothetical protein